MIGAEKKLLGFLERKMDILFFAAINILGILARLGGKDFVSRDAEAFLLPWFEIIKEAGGVRALAGQVGDYGMPYQFLIGVMTYLPFQPLYMYKFLSCVFDFGLAFISAKFICALKQSKSASLFFLAYGAVLLLPTVVLNSSVWAQCDAIYTFFVIAALYELYRERFLESFCCFGAALGFKLQAVFMLPFLLIYYAMEQKFSLIFPWRKLTGNNTYPLGGVAGAALIFYVMNIPGFLMKRSLLDPIRIYMNQIGEYRSMWLNFPSIWVLVGDNYDAFHAIAIYTTIAVLGMGLLWCVNHKIMLNTASNFMKVLIWSVWTSLLFLPAMHERYAYIFDILLVIYAFSDKSVWKYTAAAVLCSLATYGNYLCGNGIDIRLLSAVFTIGYMFFSMERFTGCQRSGMSAVEPDRWDAENEKNMG